MSDYLFLMESRLSPDQWQVVLRLQRAAEALGMTLYIAGGAVRDLICGFPIEDLDFVAEGKALHLVRALAKDGVRVVLQDDARQEAELEFPSGIVASVSMARTETYTKPSVAAIAPAPIIFDLKRRDFAINAMGISLNPHSRGLLLDPTNGAGDIERKEIRTLHNRSFLEDPVRMFRAARFRARLHFTMEQKTASQYEAAKESDMQEQASGESLAHELRQIARERNSVEILKALEKEELLQALHPHLHGPRLDLKGIAHASKIMQSMAALGLRVTSFDLFLYLLGRKLTPGDRAQLAKRLDLKKPESQGVQKLEDDAKKLGKALMGRESATPTKLYNLLSSTPPELLVLLQLEFSQSTIQSRIKTYLRDYIPLRAHLPEQELQAMGVLPGTTEFQKILETFFYTVLERKIRNRNEQLKVLKSLAQPAQPKKPVKEKPVNEKREKAKPEKKKPEKKKPEKENKKKPEPEKKPENKKKPSRPQKPSKRK